MRSKRGDGGKMAALIEADTGPEAYQQAIKMVLTCGEKTSPRLLETLEVPNVAIMIRDPAHAVPVGVGRSVVPAIGYAEATQLVAGISSLEQLDAASSGKFSAFSDDGTRLQGAYGPRLHSQMPGVIRKLTGDPGTRQAYAAVFRPGEPEKTKDVPCTLGFGFAIRNERLCMNTMMRSNDLWLGLPYDLWMFTSLQQTVAWCLGRQVGTYTHYANSLHLYTRDFAKAERVAESDDSECTPPLPMARPWPGIVPQTQLFALGWWRRASDSAWHALAGTIPPPEETHLDLDLGREVVKYAVPRWPAGSRLCGRCRYVLPPGVFREKLTCISCVFEAGK